MTVYGERHIVPLPYFIKRDFMQNILHIIF